MRRMWNKKKLIALIKEYSESGDAIIKVEVDGTYKLKFIKSSGDTIDINFKTIANSSIFGLGNFNIPVALDMGALPSTQGTEQEVSSGLYDFITQNFDNKLELKCEYSNSGETFECHCNQSYKQTSPFGKLIYHFMTPMMHLDDEEKFAFDVQFYKKDDNKCYVRYIAS